MNIINSNSGLIDAICALIGVNVIKACRAQLVLRGLSAYE